MSAEGLPTMSEVMLPCLRLLAGDATNARECLPGLKAHFNLGDGDMTETIPSGQRTRMFDRADWAIFHMMHGGLVERPRRGYYQVSPLGRDFLSTGEPLDLRTVRLMPSYIAWEQSKRAGIADTTDYSADVLVKPDASAQSSELPPEEQINFAAQAIDTALAERVLDQLLQVTPARFEQIIVDLLIAMGYGSGRAEMGRAMGKSGDGGIDGIINEDKLGLDAVYIQAKRYKPENTIGRPALQGFVGSLIGARARKGVFVTTSVFTKDAWSYVRGIEQRVVLIDGARLARLMIEHGVGVRTGATYVIRRIDEDCFSVA